MGNRPVRQHEKELEASQRVWPVSRNQFEPLADAVMNDWQIFRVFARLVCIEHAHPARLFFADAYRQPRVRM